MIWEIFLGSEIKLHNHWSILDLVIFWEQLLLYSILCYSCKYWSIRNPFYKSFFLSKAYVGCILINAYMKMLFYTNIPNNCSQNYKLVRKTKKWIEPRALPQHYKYTNISNTNIMYLFRNLKMERKTTSCYICGHEICEEDSDHLKLTFEEFTLLME